MEIPQLNDKLTRRQFLKMIGLGGTAVLLEACGGTTLPPATPTIDLSKEKSNEINIQKATELLSNVGVKNSFVETSPQAMWDANANLAVNEELATRPWKHIYNDQGNMLLFGVDPEGESVTLRLSATNQIESLPGTLESYTEQDQPHVLADWKSQNNQGTEARYVIVGYVSEEEKEALATFVSTDPRGQEMMQVLFAHSHAPLNILHLADDGMPNQVFIHPEMQDIAYAMDQADLPSSNVAGTTLLRYPDGENNITRADIFLSGGKIANLAQVEGFAPEVEFIGYCANEAYGVAIETHRIKNGLAYPSARTEAGSTGMDRAVQLQISSGQHNALFTPEQTAFATDLWSRLMR